MGRTSAFSAGNELSQQSQRSASSAAAQISLLTDQHNDALTDRDHHRHGYQIVKAKLSRAGRPGVTLILPVITCLLLVIMTQSSLGFVVHHPRVKREDAAKEHDKSANGSVAGEESTVDEFELPLWLNLTCVICLLTLSGLFSGLNLGLMSLDLNDLKVIMNSGTKSEKAYATTIAPVRARGNFLLCTLLLGNVLVNTTLTALLDDVTGSGSVAVLCATLSIVVFGEILPQAICARHGLAVGAKTIAITYIFMALTSPLSFPIAYILDICLGEEIGNVYNREQLVEYIRVTRDHNRLEDNEVGIISGALALRTKVAGDVMTPLDQVYMLPIETKLDYATVAQINARGFSRVPVYADGDLENIIGLLHARDLALVDPGDAVDLSTVLDYYKHPMVYVYVDTRLDHILQEFKAGKSHIALVKSIQTKPTKKSKWMRVLGEHPPEEHDVKTGRLLESYEVIQTPKVGPEVSPKDEEEEDDEGDPYYRLEGVITLEDIIEEILGAEIIDESDVLAMKLRERIRDGGPLAKKSSTIAGPLPFDLGGRTNAGQNHCDACCKCTCGRKRADNESVSRMSSDGNLSRQNRIISDDMTGKITKQNSVESTPTFPMRHLKFSSQKTSSIPEAAAPPSPLSTGGDQIPLQQLAADSDESPSRSKRKSNLLSFTGSRGEDQRKEESESLLSKHHLNLDHAAQEQVIPDDV